MKEQLGFVILSVIVLYFACIIRVEVESSAVPPTRPPNPNDDCATNEDCNNGSTKTRECKQGFKNMTTDCECLREQYCRESFSVDCAFKCFPKKIEGCEHWGDNCKTCQQAKGVNSCHYNEIQGECQDDGKCKYPDEKCRTNDDCEENEYCTWHNTYVSDSCSPGYYSPNECPLGECKAYQTKCRQNNECGPGKYCSMADCADDCPEGDCLSCDIEESQIPNFGCE
jgi:hypothetical protein